MRNTCKEKRKNKIYATYSRQVMQVNWRTRGESGRKVLDAEFTGNGDISPRPRV
jgi:hypothetical protein